MKIAIISDTHDNLTTLKKAIAWMNKNDIEEIIHCGDVCSPETLYELSKMFAGKIHVVFGNVDEYILDAGQETIAELPNVKLYGKTGELILSNKKIAFVHMPEIAKQLAASKKFDLVFCGHTHKPWEEKIGVCRLINPGNISNLIHKASFAVFDLESDKLELKILEQFYNE